MMRRLYLCYSYVRGVSKRFGEWCQKTEDTNKLNLLAFKIITIQPQHTVVNVHKAAGNCQQRSL
jgi:hypothetical protein